MNCIQIARGFVCLEKDKMPACYFTKENHFLKKSHYVDCCCTHMLCPSKSKNHITDFHMFWFTTVFVFPLFLKFILVQIIQFYIRQINFFFNWHLTILTIPRINGVNFGKFCSFKGTGSSFTIAKIP